MDSHLIKRVVVWTVGRVVTVEEELNHLPRRSSLGNHQTLIQRLKLGMTLVRTWCACTRSRDRCSTDAARRYRTARLQGIYSHVSFRGDLSYVQTTLGHDVKIGIGLPTKNNQNLTSVGYSGKA